MKTPTMSRLVSSIPGYTAMKYSISKASMTSYMVQTRAVALKDFLPNLVGIPFVSPHLFF